MDNKPIKSSTSELPKLISSTLILLCAFFAPWGSGTQHIASFDLSKIFVGLAVLLIFYWLLFVKHKFRCFPKYFNYFLLFVALHTLIVYVLIFPYELKFGYTGVSYLQGGFIKVQEAKGIVIARFVIFALFGYALASLLKTEKQLIALSLSYSAGLATIMIIGGYSALYGGGSEMRFSGGFLNPNAFGLTAVTSFFLNMIVLTRRYLKNWIRVFSRFFLGVTLLGVLLSGSRGAMLGLFIGFVILLIYVPNLKRKIRLVFGLLMIGAVVSFFVPQIVWETLKSRTSFERIRQDRGAKRIDIWTDYLREARHYMLLGRGMGHSTDAIKESYTFRLSVTHNNYLATWVQFGAMGLLLYLCGLYQLWEKVSGHGLKRKRTTFDVVFFSFFLAILVMLFFGDYYGCRDLWIFFGIMAAYSSWNTKLEHLRSVKNLDRVKNSRCVESSV